MRFQSPFGFVAAVTFALQIAVFDLRAIQAATVAIEGFGDPSGVTAILTSAGHTATALNAGQIETGALLSGGYDVFVVSRNTTFNGASAAYVTAVGAYVAAGGNVVTEWSGAGMFFSSYHADIRSPADNTPQLGLFSGAFHNGEDHATGTPISLLIPSHPLFSGIADPYVDGGGTEFFFWMDTTDPALVALGTFVGNGTNQFPAGQHLTAIAVGCKSGSDFVFGTHDWNDTLDSPTAVSRTFLVNAVAYAASGLACGCGNGVPDPHEACDDGNHASGDGCDAGCRVETCYTCTGTGPGSCLPNPGGTACPDDGNVCTSDLCDGSGTCIHPGDVAAGTACPDDGEVCTSDVCDGTGTCTHPGDVPAGTACPDDGEVCTSDVCDGAGACTHPGDVPAGTACPDDGSLCTSDACDGTGTCAHPEAVDCDALNQCYPPGSFSCAPDTGTCQACPVGYTAGGGGCQKTYAIDASLLDNLPATCDVDERYNNCSGPFGFHWTDVGDAAVGAVTAIDLQIEAGISCSGTNRSVLLNGNPVGSYPPAGACTCDSPHAPRLLSGIDVSSYVKGGANAVLTDDPGTCDGLTDDGSGAFAVVTVTYAALPLIPLPDGTSCDDSTFCNGADTCAAGSCTAHNGDPCPGPDGDTDCAESCDESADTCSGIDAAGTPCRPATGDCDVAETCDGTAAVCPADATQADGTGCDDGSVCTQSDTCQSGTCTGALPLDCSDGNACTTDTCDPLDGCANDDVPATGCLTAQKSIVLIKDKDDDTKDKLLWKWIKGEALSQPQLADPTDTSGYALCIYAGTSEALIADALLPPGSAWSAIGDKGYKFKGTSPDGLTNAILKGGAADKSKALAKGKGAALPDPTLPLAWPVTVQLRKADAALCLESRFTAADEKKNEAGQFKAKQ